MLILQHGEKEPLPGDPGLTARGHRQAGLAAAALAASRPALVVSSPLLRARQTAMPLAVRCGLDLHTDAGLAERINLEVGQDRDLFVQAWLTSIRDREWRPPAGRSSRDTGADMLDAVNGHAVTGRAIVVAGHGGATVDLLRDLLGDEELDARAPGAILHGLPGAAITTLTRTGSEDPWIVTGIGRTDHLPADEQTGHLLLDSGGR